MKRKPVWIDSDCGIDDAVALLAAFKLESLDIKGISAVCGNVEESKTFVNNRNIAYMANRTDVKVYHGATKPLNIALTTASHVHGNNGLGNIVIDESDAPLETEMAWDMIYKAAKEAKGELEVVAIGPLTNIAIAIAKYPDLEKSIKRLLIMGGAIEGGNATTAAEFNIYADPHAAQAVFKSSIPKVMFGLDVTLKSLINLNDLTRLKEKNSKVSNFFLESIKTLMKFYDAIGYQDTVCLHDACPILYLQYPNLFDGKIAGVYVETQGQITFGKTVSDLHSDFKFAKRDTLVMLAVNQLVFSKTIEDLLLSY